MTRARDFHLDGPASRTRFVHWLVGLNLPAFRLGLDVRVTVREEKHSDAQRRHLNAVLADIAEQVDWTAAGEKLDVDTWRALIVTEALGGRVVPGISGGAVLVARSSRDLSSRRMSEVIEYAYAFGAERGVRFRQPRMAAA